MGRESTKSPFPRLPTTLEQETFKNTGQGGPTAANFRVDVSGAGKRGHWNRAAALVFARVYTKLGNALSRDEVEVQKLFLAHIPALCKQYKRIHKIDEDPDAEKRNVRRNRQAKVSEIILDIRTRADRSVSWPADVWRLSSSYMSSRGTRGGSTVLA